jgi:hypothetical protein
MITGRLPFPDAKGPAGLITAQLKQTPQPPSVAHPGANLPPSADRVILKCLEKDKNNRFADVTAFAAAMTEVAAQAYDPAAPNAVMSVGASRSRPVQMSELGGGPAIPTPMQGNGMPGIPGGLPGNLGMAPPMTQSAPAPGASMGMVGMVPGMGAGPGPGMSAHGMPGQGPGAMTGMPMAAPLGAPMSAGAMPLGAQAGRAGYPPEGQISYQGPKKTPWVWWVVGLLALGAGVGAVMAFALR